MTVKVWGTVQGIIKGGIIKVSLLPTDKEDGMVGKHQSGSSRPSSATALPCDLGLNLDSLAMNTQIYKMKGWVRQSPRFFPSLENWNFTCKHHNFPPYILSQVTLTTSIGKRGVIPVWEMRKRGPCSRSHACKSHSWDWNSGDVLVQHFSTKLHSLCW